LTKMIFVLDRICLIGMLGASFYVGYKVGKRRAKKIDIIINKKEED